MLSDDALILGLRKLARADQRGPVLLTLSQLEQPSAATQVRDKAIEVGFRDIRKWNVPNILKRAAEAHQVVQRPTGWKILPLGLKKIEEYYAPEAAIISESRSSLRSHLEKVQDDQRRAFLEEAVKSFDVKAYRAAVVLAWVGASHILQEYVVQHHLSPFNAAGVARSSKAASNGKSCNFAPIKSLKDFGPLGEADFLQLCQDSGVLHKAEKATLQERLDLRNRCGHPNPLVIAEHAVAYHIETLMLNVYSKY